MSRPDPQKHSRLYLVGYDPHITTAPIPNAGAVAAKLMADELLKSTGVDVSSGYGREDGFWDCLLGGASSRSSSSFNNLLLRHRAVIAGGFCVRVACLALASTTFVTTSPTSPIPTTSDLDIWVPYASRRSFLAELIELLTPAYCTEPPHDPIPVAGYMDYGRFADCVQAYTWFNPRRADSRLCTVQVMIACDLGKALSTFDIDVCTVLWDGEELLAPASVWEGLRRREMSVCPPVVARQLATEFHRTLSRLRKYRLRGFRISDSSRRFLYQKAKALPWRKSRRDARQFVDMMV